MDNNIGEKMKRVRISRNLSQQEVAEGMGVSRQYVSRWESGERNINADQLIQYAKFVGVTLDYFVDNSSQRTIFQIITQLEEFFSSSNNSEAFKDNVYRRIMKIYLSSKEANERGSVIPIAAHNDKTLDDKELDLMRQDIDEL